MTKIYLASSWRNPLQPSVVEALRGADHTVYDFRHPKPGDDSFHWSEIDPDWERWSSSAYVQALSTDIAERGFHNDLEAMNWADACVLLLPSGRSAHLEAGWFVGAGRPLYILIPGRPAPELMYKLATAICLSTNALIDRLAADEPFKPEQVQQIIDTWKLTPVFEEGRPRDD